VVFAFRIPCSSTAAASVCVSRWTADTDAVRLRLRGVLFCAIFLCSREDAGIVKDQDLAELAQPE
jgi:hypothetical protein